MVIFGMSLVWARMNSKSGDVDRLRPAHAAPDHGDRLRGALAGRAALRVRAADGVDADVAELAVEEAVIGAAAEFAVGRELQSDALLQRERVLDGLVFGRGQRGLVDFAAREFRAQIEQRLGAEQAADVLGAERRLQLRQQGFLLRPNAVATAG